jgi:hypothetical protein
MASFICPANVSHAQLRGRFRVPKSLNMVLRETRRGSAGPKPGRVSWCVELGSASSPASPVARAPSVVSQCDDLDFVQQKTVDKVKRELEQNEPPPAEPSEWIPFWSFYDS